MGETVFQTRQKVLAGGKIPQIILTSSMDNGKLTVL
jgi:hypothetical protein